VFFFFFFTKTAQFNRKKDIGHECDEIIDLD